MAEEFDKETRSEQSEESRQQIHDFGSIRTKSPRGNIHCLNIIGQIEGHYVLSSQNKTTKYEHIIPSLVAIEQDRSIEGLVIILNTVGGDVEAGLAIAELVASMKKVIYCSFCHNDYSSRQNERNSSRSSSDAFLFR